MFPQVYPGTAVSGLSNSVTDLQDLLKKVDQITNELPAALAAIPKLQENSDTITAAVPILIVSLLLLTVAIVANK